MNSILQKLSPILWVKNLDETVAFYVEVLGFSSRSNFPNFASLSRDNVEIMVIVPTEEPVDCKEDDKVPFFEKSSLTGSLFILTENVDELWRKVKDQVKVESEIADREYRMRDFAIRDNNGYELVFGQDISARKG